MDYLHIAKDRMYMYISLDTKYKYMYNVYPKYLYIHLYNIMYSSVYHHAMYGYSWIQCIAEVHVHVQ